MVKNQTTKEKSIAKETRRKDMKKRERKNCENEFSWCEKKLKKGG